MVDLVEDNWRSVMLCSQEYTEPVNMACKGLCCRTQKSSQTRRRVLDVNLRKATINIDAKLGVAGEHQGGIDNQVSGVHKMAEAECR